MSFGSVYPCYIDITQLRPPQKPWGNRKVKKSTEKSKNDPKTTRSYQLSWALCMFLLLFGPFRSVSGPRGSVWPDFSFVNATLTRRIDPRSPEASANIFIFRIHYFQKS